MADLVGSRVPYTATLRSELLVNNRFAYVAVSRLNTTRTFTRTMEASLPAALAVKVRSVRQQKWSDSACTEERSYFCAK